MDVQTSSDGTINGALSKTWKITLTNSNGTLRFINFDAGDTLTLVIQEDSSGSAFTLAFPSSVTWGAGAAPNRDTTANAVAVYQFSYDGTTFRDSAGAPKALPSRIKDSNLGKISLIGSAAAIILSLSGGNGQGTGSLPPGLLIKAGSGTVTLAAIDGSGSYKTSRFAGYAVGTNNPATDRLDATSNSGSWLPNGNFRTQGTMTLAGLSSGSGKVLCVKTNGLLGVRTISGTGTLTGKCN